MTSGRYAAAGFTLLEVMIALAIIAGVGMTVIGAVNHHLAIVARDREEGVAVLLARQKLGELAAEPTFPERLAGTFAPAWPGYAWELTAVPTAVAGFRKVTLAVSWNRTQRSVALVQYVAN